MVKIKATQSRYVLQQWHALINTISVAYDYRFETTLQGTKRGYISSLVLYSRFLTGFYSLVSFPVKPTRLENVWNVRAYV